MPCNTSRCSSVIAVLAAPSWASDVALLEYIAAPFRFTADRLEIDMTPIATVSSSTTPKPPKSFSPHRHISKELHAEPFR